MSSSKRKRLDIGDDSKTEKREKQSQWDQTAPAPTVNVTTATSSSTDTKGTDTKPSAAALARRLPLEGKNPLNGSKWSPNYYKILETRKGLPVYAQRDEFTAKLSLGQVMILVGETGKLSYYPP
jgi:pre-mRNA-splicing factor ATP-dependent RNA helicase DHX15/PRP43